MKASKACFDLIKRSEALRLEAYLCPAGVPTVGWGHTNGVRLGQRITPDFAEALLQEDVEATERGLRLLFRRTFTQGEWDALVSLCFNMGTNLPTLAPRLCKHLAAGNRELAAAEFLDLDHGRVNGKLVELPGLKARRAAEAKLFLS